MTRDITPAGSPATGAVDGAFAEVRASFDRLCLAAGIEVLGTMMETDVTAACGPRHGRDAAGAPLGPDAGTGRLPRW
jgi:putative transposase